MSKFKFGDVVRINRPNCDIAYDKQIGKVSMTNMTADDGYLVTTDKQHTWMLFESELSDVQDDQAIEWILKNA